MKKSTLSISTIIVFGIYALFARPKNIPPTVINTKSNIATNTEVATGVRPLADTTIPTSQTTNPTPVSKVKKTTCEWRSSGGDDDEEGRRYVCTTTLVDAAAVPQQKIVTPTTTPVIVTPTPVVTPKPVHATSGWNDGTFVGTSIDAYYGNVQVSATISNGRLSDITFLDYPQDRNTSRQKSYNAMPILKSEAIASQSANVNSVSGATYTSEAFNTSLQSALNMAHV